MSLSAGMKALLDSVSTLKIDKEKNKVCCALSGHEMPMNETVLQDYLSGKKYKKLKEHHDLESELEKYKQHIVPSSKKQNKNQMFCKLTLRHLNRAPHQIQRHTNGKRFRKALARWEECQKTGEVFKPRGGSAKPSAPDEAEESIDEHTNVKEDDLTDLYPEEDFVEEDEDAAGDEAAEEEEEDDFQDLSDEEEEEQKAAPSTAKENKAGSKRKAQVQKNGPSKKKAKKQKTKNKKK